MLFCANHPDAAAGWRCPTHGPLCPACTGVRAAGYGRLEACARCEAMVERLRAPRRLLHPLSSVLLQTLWFPLRRSGLLTLLASAVVLFALSFFGRLASLLGLGVLVAHLFHVVRHAAAGGDDFPGPDEFRGLFDDVLGPLLRVLLAGVWLVLPLLAWHFGGEQTLTAFLESLFGWGSVPLTPLLILLVSLLLLPMGLLASALKTPLRHVALPAHLVLGPLKLGVDYWLLSLFFLLCALGGGAAVRATSIFFQRHPVPLSGLLVTLVGLYPAFVAFRAMGLLARSRGDDLGWGSAADYLEPVLDVEPAVRLGPAPARSYPPLDLDHPSPGEPASNGPSVWPLVTPSGGTPVAVLAPLTTPRPTPRAAPARSGPQPKPAAPQPPPPEAAQPPAARPPSMGARLAPSAALNSAPYASDPIAPGQLARRMTEHDLPGALAVLAESGRGIPAQTLSGAAWVELAKACLARSQPAGPESTKFATLGVLAYRRAAEVAPNGPLAPQAFLQAARLYDEVLGDRGRSDALLQELARRYPGTAEGQFAARRIGRKS